MRKINFRALIFIDLLASAMAAAVLLMLIFATATKKFQLPGGKPRDFAFFKLIAPDPDMKFKIYVASSIERDEPAISNFYNEILKKDSSSFFSMTGDNNKIKIWGPCPMPSSDSVVYNVYIAAPQNSEWRITVIYLDDKKLLNPSEQKKFAVIDSKRSLRTEYRTSRNAGKSAIHTVSLPNAIEPLIISFNQP